MEAIDQSEGVYVICPDGNVGTLVSVEIGYTKAQNKLIIFSNNPEDLGLQALSNGVVGLNELSNIKSIISSS